jgi:hypothetical protein
MATASRGAPKRTRAVSPKRFAANHDVEVLTTTARDYLSWKNEFPVGTSDVGGIRVTRYPVQKARDLARFAASLRPRVQRRAHARG